MGTLEATYRLARRARLAMTNRVSPHATRDRQGAWVRGHQSWWPCRRHRTDRRRLGGTLPGPWHHGPTLSAMFSSSSPATRAANGSCRHHRRGPMERTGHVAVLRVRRPGGHGSSLFRQNADYVRENFDESARLSGPSSLAETWFERVASWITSTRSNAPPRHRVGRPLGALSRPQDPTPRAPSGRSWKGQTTTSPAVTAWPFILNCFGRPLQRDCATARG